MPTDPKGIHALRRKAEQLLADAPEKLALMSGADVQKLLHELFVHQIELETQNEELRTSQEQLEQSRSEYADLYDFAPVGYLTFDEKALIIRANLTACSLLGIERSLLVKKPFVLFIHPDYQDLFYAHKQNALKATATETCQLVLKRKDGAFFDAQLESVPVQVNGQPALNSILTDITERRQFEKERQTASLELEKKVKERTAELSRANELLRKSESREREQAGELATLLETVPTPVIIVHDQDGLHMTGNRAASELLRIPGGAEVCRVGGCDQGLRWYASRIHAGAPEELAFDHGHFHAAFGKTARQGRPRLSGSDDYCIVFPHARPFIQKCMSYLTS